MQLGDPKVAFSESASVLRYRLHIIKSGTMMFWRRNSLRILIFTRFKLEAGKVAVSATYKQSKTL